MKNNCVLVLALAVALAGCSKPAAEKPAAAADKTDASSGVTMDAETQARIGLKIESPAATQWQPETKGFGRVIESVTLTAAVTDLESARVAAEVSIKELARQKTLAAQDNAPARALETANATFVRENAAYAAAEARFKLEWGSAFASASNWIDTGTMALVRIDLPAGKTLPAPPASARIVAMTDETKPVRGEFVGATDGVNPQTQSQGFFFSIKNGALPPGAAVTGFFKTSGEPMGGVTVPASAVVRHEGAAWVYVQTQANQFSRVEISLDCPADDGWFVKEKISTNSRVVVEGAQALLSAEFSSGEGGHEH